MFSFRLVPLLFVVLLGGCFGDNDPNRLIENEIQKAQEDIIISRNDIWVTVWDSKVVDDLEFYQVVSEPPRQMYTLVDRPGVHQKGDQIKVKVVLIWHGLPILTKQAQVIQVDRHLTEDLSQTTIRGGPVW